MIGVNTVTQFAYSDPVQLAMRTCLSFTFVLDIGSQALAWVYLEDKLNMIRLRGSYELWAFARNTVIPLNPHNAAALKLLFKTSNVIGLSDAQFSNILHEISDDPLMKFLILN